MPAIIVTLVSGIVQMIRLDGGNLFSSSHGQVLLLKVVGVAAMLAVAMAVRQQVGMRLDAAHEMTVPLADLFRRAFGAEAALGVVVLAFSGWMLALTPPKVDPLAGETYTREIPFSDGATGIDTTVFIGPATVGRNGLKVVVTEPSEGITTFVLRFTPPEGGQWILEQPIPLTGEGTAVLDDSVGLPFDVPGVWTLELVASTAAGVQEGAAITFEVFNADGSRVTIPETPPSSPVSVSIVDQSTTTAPVVTTTLPPVTSTSAPPG
jgi:copper transport protein